MSLVSIPQWAQLRGITREHAARLARDGKIRAEKVGGRYLVSADEPLPPDGRIGHCKRLRASK